MVKLMCKLHHERGERVSVGGAQYLIGKDGAVDVSDEHADSLLQNTEKWTVAQERTPFRRPTGGGAFQPILEDNRTGEVLDEKQTADHLRAQNKDIPAHDPLSERGAGPQLSSAPGPAALAESIKPGAPRGPVRDIANHGGPHEVRDNPPYVVETIERTPAAPQGEVTNPTEHERRDTDGDGDIDEEDARLDARAESGEPPPGDYPDVTLEGTSKRQMVLLLQRLEREGHVLPASFNDKMGKKELLEHIERAYDAMDKEDDALPAGPR